MPDAGVQSSPPGECRFKAVRRRLAQLRSTLLILACALTLLEYLFDWVYHCLWMGPEVDAATPHSLCSIAVNN